jgi:hypothetical protein
MNHPVSRKCSIAIRLQAQNSPTADEIPMKCGPGGALSVQPDGKSRWQISNEKCIRAGRPVLMPSFPTTNPVILSEAYFSGAESLP